MTRRSRFEKATDIFESIDSERSRKVLAAAAAIATIVSLAIATRKLRQHSYPELPVGDESQSVEAEIERVLEDLPPEDREAAIRSGVERAGLIMEEPEKREGRTNG